MMLLSCPLCLKPHFEGVESLRTTLVNVATAPLTCPVCQETLKGLDKFTIHLFGHVNNVNVHNSDNGVMPESVCDVEKRQQDETIDNNIKQSPSCCTVKIEKAPTAILPIDNNPPPDIIETPNYGLISCDICNFKFMDKNILEMHQKLLHQTSPDDKGKYSYHCHLCSKRFRMRGSLMVHLRVAHYGFNNHVDSPPHLIQNNNDEKVIETNPKSQESKQWGCDVCAKMFTTKYFLRKHKRLHTGEMPYSCTICNKSFTFQQSFHKHMLYHSSDKPYVCSECGRAFKEHSTLQNHARIHSGERPFGCEICGKRFRQRVSFLVHMRIHTGVMPYKCTACNKSFRYKVSQKSHKCPATPPGSVIKISDTGTSPCTAGENNMQAIPPTKDVQNTEHISHTGKISKCIMSVDYNTGNINFIPENILPNAENEINTGLRLSFQHSMSKRSGQNFEETSHPAPDAYPLQLSPILNEVQSMCIQSNSPGQPPSPLLEENIQDIREKCLEEFFQIKR